MPEIATFETRAQGYHRRMGAVKADLEANAKNRKDNAERPKPEQAEGQPTARRRTEDAPDGTPQAKTGEDEKTTQQVRAGETANTGGKPADASPKADVVMATATEVKPRATTSSKEKANIANGSEADSESEAYASASETELSDASGNGKRTKSALAKKTHEKEGADLAQQLLETARAEATKDGETKGQA